MVEGDRMGLPPYEGLLLAIAGLLTAGPCGDAASEAPCPPGACDPLCVDAGRYRVTDAVVVDGATGDRLWQRRLEAKLPWEDAVAYCENLTLDGRRGWSLPSPDQLDAIRYKPGGLFGGPPSRHYCVPSIDQAAFPDTPPDLFWTSRRMPDDTAWYVDFADGRQHRDTRTEPHWVRCTHDGG
jgi:hypothetical protein